MDNISDNWISRRGLFTIVAGAGVGVSASPARPARDVQVDRQVEGTVSNCYRKHVVVTTDSGERFPVHLPEGLLVKEGDRLRAMVKNKRVGYITRNVASTAVLVT